MLDNTINNVDIKFHCKKNLNHKEVHRLNSIPQQPSLARHCKQDGYLCSTAFSNQTAYLKTNKQKQELHTSIHTHFRFDFLHKWTVSIYATL